jgi:hypothetical protein
VFSQKVDRFVENLSVRVSSLGQLVGKSTAVNESKCLFEHDSSANEDNLPVQRNSIFDAVM